MASWDKCRLGLEASNIRNRGLLVENSGLGPKDPWLLFALKFVRSNKCRRLTPIMVKKHTTSKPSIIDSLVCDGTWTIRQSIGVSGGHIMWVRSGPQWNRWESEAACKECQVTQTRRSCWRGLSFYKMSATTGYPVQAGQQQPELNSAEFRPSRLWTTSCGMFGLYLPYPSARFSVGQSVMCTADMVGSDAAG